MFSHPSKFLAFLGLSLAMGALAACSTTSNIRACESHDQCPTGQSCIESACIVNVSESCGPAGVTCQSFEVCSQSGTCECSTDLANTPDACGCEPLVNCADVAASPIMQMACILNESIGALECVCDETYHAFDDGACGCELENCEKDGNVCENGACSCVVANHMYDSHSCACGAACAGGEICSAGECICAEGTTRCGDQCIPYGYTCCSDSGDFCPVGTTCRDLDANTTTCQPSGTTPCFQNGEYIGNCAPEETCIVDAASQPHCLAPGVPVCLKGGNYFGQCVPGETCIVDDAEKPHCLPPGASPCFKDGTFFGQCDPKETCIVDDMDAIHCVPPGAAPCYAGLDFAGICSAGTKCANGKCIAPEESLCGDLATVCSQGQTCVEASMGMYDCHPAGSTACYTSDDYYGWHCNPGWNCGPELDECTLPGWKECPGPDSKLCPSSEKCIKVNKENGYDCAPNEAVVCYELDDGVNVAKGWCPAYQQCTFDGTGCLPPGWTECGEPGIMCPQGATCVPKGLQDWTCFYPGSVACYQDNWFHHACPIGEKCTKDGCES